MKMKVEVFQSNSLILREFFWSNKERVKVLIYFYEHFDCLRYAVSGVPECHQEEEGEGTLWIIRYVITGFLR